MNFHIHGNRGIAITVYGIDLGYNCSYDAVGERIDKESMSHSGCIGTNTVWYKWRCFSWC